MPKDKERIPNGKDETITVQFPKSHREYLQEIKDKYGYEKLANAAKNCVKVAYLLHADNPEQFFTLLNKTN